MIGHNVTTCKWLHPDATKKKPERGKKPLVADTPPNPPLQSHGLRNMGASTSAQAVMATSLEIVVVAAPSSTTLVSDIQGQTLSHSATPINDISSNSFDFALHNVLDKVS